MKPKISILIPTYKRNEYLIEAIKSCLSQTKKPYEVIIKDNDPTSITFLPKLPKNFRYIKNKKNIGMINNFFSLAKICKGDYFIFLADDDILNLKFIETWTSIIKKYPKINIFTSPVATFKNKKILSVGKIFNKDRILHDSIKKTLWYKTTFGFSTFTPATLYKKSFFNKLKITDYGNETDVDISMKILNSKEKVYFYKNPLFFYRRSNIQFSGYKNKKDKIAAIIKNIDILRKNSTPQEKYIFEMPASIFIFSTFFNIQLIKKFKFKLIYFFYFFIALNNFLIRQIQLLINRKKYQKELNKIYKNQNI